MSATEVSTAVTHVEVRSGAYADSVALLQVSKDVAAAEGVLAAQVAMATPLNLGFFESMGFDVPEATANDMVIAVRIAAAADLDRALAAVDAALASATRREGSGGTVEVAPRTTGSAVTRFDAALALISVPGPHAAVEAMDALDRNCDVMIFSDNVPVEQEVVLKEIARDRDLLMMGPDCGTAMIGGVGLGFANVVGPGPVGLVAASGTGCQQIMCLLEHAGVGMSAALGVGGRDLSEAVGALGTKQALRRLDADPATELIVVVSKPPDRAVDADVRAYAATLSTRVEFAVLGADEPDLTGATESVLATLGRQVPDWPQWNAGGAGAASYAHGFLRGLFVGGTLCDEAMLIATDRLGPIHSNIPLEAAHRLDATMSAEAHLMIDFGDDELTVGRAHPMIDPAIRLDYLRRTSRDPQTSVILLDLVLGHGAEPDPQQSLAPAISDALAAAQASSRDLAIVVSCVGTEADPQHLQHQAAALADAGAEVFLSNAQAVRRAVDLIGANR